MTVCELSHDQMIELKQDYLRQHYDECEDRSPSYGELAAADEIVSDHTIYENYDGYDFSEDDFFCSCCQGDGVCQGNHLDRVCDYQCVSLRCLLS